MSNQKTDLSRVVKIIPTYNEKGNIASLVGAIFEHTPEASVLVVDDNSPDGTAVIVKELQGSYPNLQLHRRSDLKGFGKSYIEGFKKIAVDEKYDHVVMMDADFSHDFKEVPAMAAKLNEYDMVVGSRYINGGRIENWSLWRKLLSRFANFYARTILSAKTRDLTTGFMCFRKNILNTIHPETIKSDGYAFLVEFKYRTEKAGLKIIEHPIVYTERREGESKMYFAVIAESVLMPWRLRFSRK